MVFQIIIIRFTHTTSFCVQTLFTLNLLTLLYHLELLDLLFVLKCLKDPPDSFNIFYFISFSSSSTQSSSSHKLECKFHCSSSTHHQYFNRVVLLWNDYSPIDLSSPFSTIKKTLQQQFWNTFLIKFNNFSSLYPSQTVIPPINITLPPNS